LEPGTQLYPLTPAITCLSLLLLRIGFLADTHLPGSIREPWPQMADAVRHVDLILHAGDIISPTVLDWLERIAPVLVHLAFGLVTLSRPSKR